MRQRQGFTLIELLVVVAIIALLIGILLPSLSRAREVANRTVSASNLSGIYKALYQYSTSNDENFPRYSSPNGGQVTAFRADNLRGQNNPNMGGGGDLAGNVTACLWRLIKNGSVAPKQYTNPSDKGAREDDMTNPNNNNQTSMALTWDFTEANNISYSTMNMYDGVAGRQWSSKVKPDYVIMGDDNNADSNTRGGGVQSNGLHMNDYHEYQGNNSSVNDKGLQQNENSENHSQGEGGNFMFGDGHVDFEQHPFVGRNQDNANALTNNAMPIGNPSGYQPQSTRPTMETSGGQGSTVIRENRGFDAVLLPVTGNDDQNLAQYQP